MSVRVVARIRPLLGKEFDKEVIVRAESSQESKCQNVVRIPNPKKETEEFSFTFNAVYDAKASQEELFTSEVSPHLKSLFRGLDLTIFAYGVTGTGKTHTMRGGMKLADRGVIPRLLSAIYRRGRKVTKDSGGETTIEVSLAYYEIYNDKVYDLFEKPEKRTLAGLPLREKDGKTVVVGLSEHACNDLKEFEKLYIEANHNRSTAGTKLNSQSSRSHAILQVKVSQITGDRKLVSIASAIDLAGSEDNRRTENNKERMVESASINKSLFVLSSCIDAIGRGDKRIPYRESRMTRILSLGQNQGITIMILNLAPLRSYHLDTLSSLNVSSRAKRIEVREIENEIVFTRPPGKTTSISGLSVNRQPLRPLLNAHNTHPSVSDQKGLKPSKSFSVYNDKSKHTNRSVAVTSQTNPKISISQKRPPENSLQSRPTKSMKLTTTGRKADLDISSETIERIIEKKVQEALASRALDRSDAITSSGISESVERRLEALEKKIENGEAEESKSDGLRFLLLAKQHKERGENFSAMKMYELAIPYYPEQEKQLQRKIECLRIKVQIPKKVNTILNSGNEHDQESSSKYMASSPTSAHVSKINSSPSLDSRENIKESFQQTLSDNANDIFDDFLLQVDNEDDNYNYQKSTKPKKSKMKNTTSTTANMKPITAILSDDTDPLALPTPRTQHLLNIINSRDITMIRGLHGVGEKKAKDLVEFLELQNEEEGGNIRTLQELISVPGLGKRSVERAYEGLTALIS
ncbi:hypothetical protein EPUL_004281 [Erysiphe pulchra]|uniref:Kinesin motor domain-containing protein n=1 Tax=Erysiphe pulchra TaxID=225359 RepID=A0A2S4PPF4_9PEZI|nr:hypothetical protein EPUL_004281 [Erysiphe pulchra]